MAKRSCTECFHSDVCYAMGRWPERAETCTKYYATVNVAEVRHGKWTENKTEYFLYGCSLCGYRVDNEYNFCPECGAKMDGDEDGV